MHRHLALSTAFCLALAACQNDIVDGNDDLAEIRVSVDSARVFTGDTLPLTASGRTTSGVQFTAVTASWSTSDSTIVQVDASGRVIARRRGLATVTARAGSVSGSTIINVDSIIRLQVYWPEAGIRYDEQATLTASLITVAETIPLLAGVLWSTRDTQIVSLSANGVVTPRQDRNATRDLAIIEGVYKGFTRAAFLTITRPPSLPSVNRQAACAATGRIHYESEGPGTWRLSDSPHYLVGEVTVTNVTVEPGVVVCAYPGARLVTKSSMLTANGSADRPIRFTAVDTLQKWVGIDMNKLNGSASLSHSLVEFTTSGISGWGGQLTLLDSRVRGGTVSFCANFTSVNIRRSVIEGGDVCVSDGTFEDNVIRNGGLTVAWDRSLPGTLALNGGRIENGPNRAFKVVTQGYTPPTVTSTKPLRIVGAAGNPIDSSLEIFTQIWPTRAAQDSLLGNAKDTLLLWGGDAQVSRPLFARRDLPWSVYSHQSYPPSGIFMGDLTVEAGTTMTYGRLVVKGAMNILGTGAQPIRMVSADCDWCGLYLAGSAASQMRNVVFEAAGITVMEQHSLSLQFCDIVKTEFDGVRVVAGATGIVEIHDCNIERNRRLGVNNQSMILVNAQRNWWGDPAGPLGPAGDGVAGNVDTSGQLTTRR